MTPEEYEQKRKARYFRLLAAAEKAEKEANASLEEASKMASVIPMGQPILVGHYSEGGDRRYRARVDAKQRKGYDLLKKSEALRRRLAAMERNKTIFSNDPNAIEKIGERIERLQARQELMRAANKLVRKGDREGLRDLGFSDVVIEGLFTPDFANRIGFPDYEITNNGANIRRLKKRMDAIADARKDETTEKIIGDIRVVDNVDDNRIQIFFPGKPGKKIRSLLKFHGFRWTPSRGCWQAYRGSNSSYWAEKIANEAT